MTNKRDKEVQVLLQQHRINWRRNAAGKPLLVLLRLRDRQATLRQLLGQNKKPPCSAWEAWRETMAAWQRNEHETNSHVPTKQTYRPTLMHPSHTDKHTGYCIWASRFFVCACRPEAYCWASVQSLPRLPSGMMMIMMAGGADPGDSWL